MSVLLPTAAPSAPLLAPIRLALVEDDARLRALLKEYLSRQPEFECVVVAGSVEEFQQEIEWSLPPQVVLLDIGLPGLTGLEALPDLRQRLPNAEFIVQTVFDDTDRVYQALRLGASGYLLKSSPLPEYKAAVLDVVRGGAPMSRAVARKVLAHFKPAPSLDANALTDRERDVLHCLVEGMGEKQAAARLGVAPATVHTHVKSIYRKLQVGSRGELLGRAARGEL
jgi:DNA-binding NarL/FixJ family response regulator